MEKIENVQVPHLDPLTIPLCPHCQQLFVQASEHIPDVAKPHDFYFAFWQQSCDCGSHGDYLISTWPKSENGYEHCWQGKTGDPRFTYCVLCPEIIPEGSDAVMGTMGPYSYHGYAHPICYRDWLQTVAAAQVLKDQTHQGICITVWYWYHDPQSVVQNTGHTDGHVRMLPEALPPLPEGRYVVYELYRKPFAASQVDFVDEQEAQAWWDAATHVEQAAYELHWYDAGKKNEKASRLWVGADFGRVQSNARMMEWDAESGKNWRIPR
jgi:hypothetical protein